MSETNAKLPADIDEWLAPNTAAEFAEAAYDLARRSHDGQIPKFLRMPWFYARRQYRDFLIFLAQYAMDSAKDANVATLTAERDKLKEEKEKLLEVLRPFAEHAAYWNGGSTFTPISSIQVHVIDGSADYDWHILKLGDLRAAAALIKELEGK